MRVLAEVARWLVLSHVDAAKQVQAGARMASVASAAGFGAIPEEAIDAPAPRRVTRVIGVGEGTALQHAELRPYMESLRMSSNISGHYTRAQRMRALDATRYSGAR
jgi:hypothetical protein